MDAVCCEMAALQCCEATIGQRNVYCKDDQVRPRKMLEKCEDSGVIAICTIGCSRICVTGGLSPTVF